MRVGTDLVEVSAISESIARWGDRYLGRVYTAQEVAYCQSSPALSAERFAARFAAKEAVLKVLRPIGVSPAWRNIEVVRHSHGWCEIALHGSAASLADEGGVRIISCSLSHEGAYANAVVLGIADAG